MTLVVRPLDPRDDRSAFSCGRKDLDDWFRHRAGQDQRRNVARVFVAVDEERIAGFYSLGSFTLALDDLPVGLARRLPHYDAIPAARIRRLARDLSVRGQGIGELLVADAIRRILGAADSVAVFAIVVDAKDAGAAAFYRKFGFIGLPSTPLRLFLPTAVAADALRKSSK